MIEFKRPLALTAGALLATAALGTGTALASTHQTSPVPNVTSTVSGSNVQQGGKIGDQTAADSPSATPETSGEASTEAAAPAGTETDGPGGHADKDGTNVDHQFNGQE